MNMADMIAKGRRRSPTKGDDEPCPHGHVGDFYRDPRTGKRYCRECNRQNCVRRYRERRKR